jgi:hypothetical protein
MTREFDRDQPSFDTGEPRRPTSRGRKPTRKTMSTTATHNPLELVAKDFARDAFENCFESRRGIWSIADVPGAFCLYDNNPFEDFGAGMGSANRDRIITELRSFLEENGHQELASATYPEEGDDAGYTFAMIVVGDKEAIRDAWIAAIGAEYGILGN